MFVSKLFRMRSCILKIRVDIEEYFMVNHSSVIMKFEICFLTWTYMSDTVSTFNGWRSSSIMMYVYNCYFFNYSVSLNTLECLLLRCFEYNSKLHFMERNSLNLKFRCIFHRIFSYQRNSYSFISSSARIYN